MVQTATTHQRILDEALSLFARSGYDSVTVADIAAAVGIRAPSLYKHYPSKQAIFDAILAEMAARYEHHTASDRIGGRPAGQSPKQVSEDDLVQLGVGLLEHFLHGEYQSRFRRMLLIEQHANPMLAHLYATRYIDAPLAYATKLFSSLAFLGQVIAEDPAVMALQFHAPILLLLTICDCHPDREAWSIATLEAHIRQFARLYLV